MAIMKTEGSYIPQEFEENIYKSWEEKGYFRANVNDIKTEAGAVTPENMNNFIDYSNKFMQQKVFNKTIESPQIK